MSAQLTSVEIAAVSPCDCPSHAVVVLRETGGRRRFRVRVHSDAGQAVLAELAGVASSRAGCADMLRGALAAEAAEPAGVIISACDDAVSAALIVRGPTGEQHVGVEPCEALVVACRLGLKLFVCQQSSPSGVPEVYNGALEGVDLSGFGAG